MLKCPNCFSNLTEIDQGVAMLHAEIERLKGEVAEALNLAAELVYAQGGRIALDRYVVVRQPPLELMVWEDVANRQRVFSAQPSERQRREREG